MSDIVCDYIDNKNVVHTIFRENNRYFPLSYQKECLYLQHSRKEQGTVVSICCECSFINLNYAKIYFLISIWEMPLM